jgi:REP element-mobilizing transposase RayT
MRPKQFSFLPQSKPEFGGDLAPGRRKKARPIDPKQTMHIVLRSSRATGAWSMLSARHRAPVDDLVRKTAERHGLKLYRYANVGNHLHLLVKTPTRRAFQRFLRDVAGSVACLVTGAKNSQPLKARFWDRLAYTRIVSWGRDFKNIEFYFIKNLFEAAGLLTKKAKTLGLQVIPLAGWAAGP